MHALKLQVDAAKLQLLQGLVRALTTAAAPSPAPGMNNLMALLEVSNGGQHGGVDHNMLLQHQQCQWNEMNSLPALSWSAPRSGMFDGFSTGHGLSSTELGGHDRARGSNGTIDPMLDDDLECNNNVGGGVLCEDTPASSPFHGLESLNLMDEITTDGGWKDLLEQMPWLNSSEL